MAQDVYPLVETQQVAQGGQAFVQPTQPAVDGAYLWVQTGLGEDGTEFTIWIEDGQPDA